VHGEEGREEKVAREVPHVSLSSDALSGRERDLLIRKKRPTPTAKETY